MIEISDRLQAVAGDLVRLVGSVEIRLVPDELNDLGYLFSIEYGGYVFKARIADGVVSVRRNNGLTKQLPRFMDSQKAEFGILLVMWYGTSFSRSPDITPTSLEAELVRHQLKHHSTMMAKRISFFCIDLTLPVKAGRKRIEVPSWG